MENWKDISGFTNYEVSDTGKIRNKTTGSILKGWPNKKGYTCVTLYSDTTKKAKPVHRLVAESFIPNPENKITVNHINGDKNNNQVSNLEWSTYSENNKHALDNKLRTVPKGSNDSKSKLNEEQVTEIATKYFPNKNFTNESIAKMYGVARGTISKIRQRKTWCHVTNDLEW